MRCKWLGWWWWYSGQHPRLLLWRTKFESCRILISYNLCWIVKSWKKMKKMLLLAQWRRYTNEIGYWVPEPIQEHWAQACCARCKVTTIRLKSINIVWILKMTFWFNWVYSNQGPSASSAHSKTANQCDQMLWTKFA